MYVIIIIIIHLKLSKLYIHTLLKDYILERKIIFYSYSLYILYISLHYKLILNTLFCMHGFYFQDVEAENDGKIHDALHQTGGCKVGERSQRYTCSKCERSFKHLSKKTRHEGQCEKVHYQCNKCPQTFTNVRNLLRHAQTVHPTTKEQQRMYTCRHAGCTVMCSSRQQLYIHKMNQHGHGENQQEPWNSEDGAPWSTMEEDTGRQLRSTYMLNKQHILRQNSLGAIRKDYNFPTNDLREGTDEILNYVKYVFEQQSSSFKFNMAFGLILRNEEDEEFKYFIPYTNATIFPSNLVISAKKDLLKISEYESSGLALNGE